MLLAEWRLQSPYAGIRREGGRTRALRNHDGRAARPLGRDHGRHHGCYGTGRSAWGLLPKPALAGQTCDGHSDHYEEPDGREGADPERDGRVEEEDYRIILQRQRGGFP